MIEKKSHGLYIKIIVFLVLIGLGLLRKLKFKSATSKLNPNFFLMQIRISVGLESKQRIIHI